MSDDIKKIRIVQELVPGREITLAHLIASPSKNIYEDISDEENDAIGIMSVSPFETAIIMADIAIKASGVSIKKINMENGSLIISGKVSEVKEALEAVIAYVRDVLKYSVCDITKT